MSSLLRRRVAPLLAVLLLHGLLVLGLATVLRPAPPAGGAPAGRVQWLRLLPGAAPDQPMAVPLAPAQRGVSGKPPVAVLAGRRAPAVPAGPSVPVGPAMPVMPADPSPSARAALESAESPVTAQPAAAAAQATQPAPVIAAPPAAAASAPLNLALPRPRDAVLSPAAQARREGVNRPPNLPEARWAAALGTDTTLHEEVRGDTRRFRQGRACVDLAPTREAQLNPFNQSAAPTPRLAKPC